MYIYIYLGDGIFDQLSDKEVNDCIWMTLQDGVKGTNVHSHSGIAVDMVLKSSLCRKTLDNVTCVLICFENFERTFNRHEKTKFNTLTGNLENSKIPKIVNIEENEKKNNFEKILSPKINSTKSLDKKIISTSNSIENIKDSSSYINKVKTTNFDTISNNSFYKTESKPLNYKKIDSTIKDPFKLKLNRNNFIKKVIKKDILDGLHSHHNSSKISSSMEQRLKVIKKEKSITRVINNSNATTAKHNESHHRTINCKITNKLDFSEQISDSKLDLKNKFEQIKTNKLTTKKEINFKKIVKISKN